MGNATVRMKAVTVLPVVFALLFMFLISAIVLASIARAYMASAESSKREAEEHSMKVKQNVKTYIYNVSLCKILNIINKGVAGKPISEQELDTSGPVKILVANEGGKVVRLEHVVVKALGSIVYEAGIDTRLSPGGYILYYPRDLSLPEDYELLKKYLDMISFFGGGEIYNMTVFQPPPITYVEVDEYGVCHEP